MPTNVVKSLDVVVNAYAYVGSYLSFVEEFLFVVALLVTFFTVVIMVLIDRRNRAANAAVLIVGLSAAVFFFNWSDRTKIHNESDFSAWTEASAKLVASLETEHCPIVIEAVRDGTIKQLEREDVDRIRVNCTDRAFLEAVNAPTSVLNIAFATTRGR